MKKIKIEYETMGNGCNVNKACGENKENYGTTAGSRVLLLYNENDLRLVLLTILKYLLM